jgi:hypothetical protein
MGTPNCTKAARLRIKAAGLLDVAIADIAKVPRRCADSNKGMKTAAAVV